MPMVLTMIAWSLLMGWFFVGIALGEWLMEPFIGVVVSLGLAALITEFQRRAWARKYASDLSNLTDSNAAR